MTDRFEQMPSQTIDLFFGVTLPFRAGSAPGPGHHRDAIRLCGTVTDGLGVTVTDFDRIGGPLAGAFRPDRVLERHRLQSEKTP